MSSRTASGSTAETRPEYMTSQRATMRRTAAQPTVPFGRGFLQLLWSARGSAEAVVRPASDGPDRVASVLVVGRDLVAGDVVLGDRFRVVRVLWRATRIDVHCACGEPVRGAGDAGRPCRLRLA